MLQDDLVTNRIGDGVLRKRERSRQQNNEQKVNSALMETQKREGPWRQTGPESLILEPLLLAWTPTCRIVFTSKRQRPGLSRARPHNPRPYMLQDPCLIPPVWTRGRNRFMVRKLMKEVHEQYSRPQVRNLIRG